MAQKRPKTLPVRREPALFEHEDSCRVTISPSIPVTSVMLVTRRVPSLMREHCTRMWTAAAICCRIAVRCMLALASVTITSRREIASRGAVRVDRRQRAVVARVHRLQHVERFLAAHLAHDDPVRPHTQAVDQQLPLPHRALCLRDSPGAFPAAPRAAASTAVRPHLRWSRCAPWAK